MKFYHNFYTDLPDQFVEANSDRLIKWVEGWSDKNRYYRRSMIIDSVSIDVIGNAKIHDWPTLKSASRKMVELWLAKKGDQYNGGYWDTLAEDQRSPAGVASDPRRNPRITNYAIDPRTVSAISCPGAGGVVWTSTRVELERPPLKRDGIVAGEIVGYRCWRIERGLLRSVYQPDVWQPDEVLVGRELGDWDSRGIHAWKDAGSKQYHDYIRGYLNADTTFRHFITYLGKDVEEPDPRPAMVTGTVFLWGDVVEHERGYRAEFARVRSLDWLYPDATMMGCEPETLNSLRQKYVTASSSVFEKRST